MNLLIIDCLTAGNGKRIFTRDFIGAGPRTIAGFIEEISEKQVLTTIVRGEECLEGAKKSQMLTYNCIAISAMSMDEELVRRIIQLWRGNPRNNLNTLCIVGGPIAAENSLINSIKADLMICGEAESALAELFHNQLNKILNFLSLSKKENIGIEDFIQINSFNNIISRKNKDERKSSELPKKNVDYFRESCGYPEKIKLYPDYQQSRIYIDCVRGCSNFRRTSLILKDNPGCLSSIIDSQNQTCDTCRHDSFHPLLDCPAQVPPGCGFCSTIRAFGPARSRNIDVILNEVQKLISYGARRLVLGGPDFLDYYRERELTGPLINPNLPEPNYTAIESLIQGLLTIPEIKTNETQLFIENIKPSLCTDKALDLLAKIPNPIFSIGCETGSAEFANIIGRPSTPSTTLDVVKRAQTRGIRVHVYFIHSLPGDAPKYIQETLQLLNEFAKLNVEKITLYKYQELPGSPFWKIDPNYTNFSKDAVKLTNKLKDFIIQYNQNQKYRLIGKTLSVFLSEPNSLQPKDAIGWLLEGGPKVSVIQGANFIGNIKRIKIKRVISDRLIEGEII